MTWTIKYKLNALAGAGLIGVALVAAVGHRGLATLGERLEDNQTDSAAKRNHLEADMMHDAVRADVQAAFLAHTPEDHASAADDLDGHLAHFQESLTANEHLPLPAEITSALAGVRPALDTYIASAKSIIALAAKDKDAAWKTFPAFEESFEALEKKMSATSDVIEATLSAAVAASATESSHGAHAIEFLGALTFALLLALSVGIARSILRPLAAITARLDEVGKGDGDLTIRVNYGKADELGALATAFNTFVAKN